MKKINVENVPEGERKSPTGKYCRYFKEISVALGSDFRGNDPGKRHPFDLMLTRVPPGAIFCPYHAHSAQWEMYLVVSGRGMARDEAGEHEIGAGDAFVYQPGEAHQISNPHDVDLVYYIFTDNPRGDSTTYPNSRKWMVWDGLERVVIQGAEADYWTDEE